MTRTEILDLLYRVPYEELRQEACRVTLREKGTHVFVRGLIEFSNVCRRNCRYCGLQVQNTQLHRYFLSHDEILSCAEEAVAAGVDTIVLQSGESRIDTEWMASVIRDLKTRLGITVTLSVGEQPREALQEWKQAGASRFLMKHETADPELYASLHPGWTLEGRIEGLKLLADLGYEAGTGFIIGVPGQRPEVLADDILLAASLHSPMVGAGPFIPQHATPFKDEPRGSADLTLRVMSILRLVLPKSNFPATTALATIGGEDGQTKGLLAGGNVLMPSFTPAERRADYTIYDNKRRVDIELARLAIERAGRTHGLKACPLPAQDSEPLPPGGRNA